MKNEKLRIFIAEDEAIVLAGFLAMIEEFGYEVVGTAMDGEEAIPLILELKPDLILTDVNLPKVDGITVIETVNQQVEIPAIVVTGYRSQTYMDRAVKGNIYGYLQKPLDEYELRSAIRIAYMQFEKKREATEGKEAAERMLRDRKVIERAKGLLMDQFGLTEQQAMKALQKRSADKNKKLIVVAKEILSMGEKL